MNKIIIQPSHERSTTQRCLGVPNRGPGNGSNFQNVSNMKLWNRRETGEIKETGQQIRQVSVEKSQLYALNITAQIPCFSALIHTPCKTKECECTLTKGSTKKDKGSTILYSSDMTKRIKETRTTLAILDST